MEKDARTSTLGRQIRLKHAAVGYRPGYPPPNRVHNNRFLPPRLLHTVHIQIHTRRAASRGGPGATTVPAVGGRAEGQLPHAPLQALPLPPLPRHLRVLSRERGHLWARGVSGPQLPSHSALRLRRHPCLREHLVRPSASGRRAGAARERRSDIGGSGGGGCSSEPLRRLCGSWWRRWPAWTWAGAASAPRKPQRHRPAGESRPAPARRGWEAGGRARSLPPPLPPRPSLVGCGPWEKP